MQLFGRYMLRQAMGAVAMVVISLTLLVWVALCLRQISMITSGGQSAKAFFAITALVLPDLMTIIAPLALLIGCLHTLNRLNGDSELIVMTAAGTNVWRYARALLPLAAGVSLLIGLASFYVVPWSLQTQGSLVNQVRADLITQVLQPGQFVTPESGVTIHIRNRTDDGRMQGLMLADTRDEEQHLTYLAETSSVRKEGEAAYLVMQNGNIIRTNPKKLNDGASIIAYDTYVIDLSVIAPKGAPEPPKPHAMYMGDLLFPDTENYFYRRNPQSFIVEFHDRIATLIYPFTFLMCAIAYMGQARTNRQGRTQALIAAFSVSIGLRLGGMAAANVANQDLTALPFMYAVPVIGLILGIIGAHRGMVPAPKSALVRRVEAAMDVLRTRTIALFTAPFRRSRPVQPAAGSGS
jgi:lipopolysaccharide export system permease protein